MTDMTNAEAIEIFEYLISVSSRHERENEALSIGIAALSAPKKPLRVTQDGVCVPVVPPIEGLREALKTKEKSYKQWVLVGMAAQSYLELSEGDDKPRKTMSEMRDVFEERYKETRGILKPFCDELTEGA